MANEKKAFGINLPNLTQHEQEMEEIIARKKDASVIYENEQQSQKEARANAEETRKRCLETFPETSRRTTETNNEEDTKKKRNKAEWNWDNKLLSREKWKQFRIKERRKQH